MVSFKVDINTKGELFKDVQPAIEQLERSIRLELVQMGESRLDQVLRPRPSGVYLTVAQAQRGKASTGNFRRSVHARHSQIHSTIESNVIYGPWLEGDSSRNAITRFKGYQSFRKTAQWLQSQARAVATKHVNKYVRKMNGSI